MPTVSICVPTFNGEGYLVECLDSIVHQTFSNFEVIIVDDCSTDASLTIANDYARRFPNFRVSQNSTNVGLAGNWNRCVQLSTGEWIKFVFQDDIIAPDCLKKMVEAADSGHLLISCARDFIFERNTTVSDKKFYDKHERFIEDTYARSTTLSANEFSDCLSSNIGSNLLGEPTVTLLHKSVFETFDLFNTWLIHDADNEYWARVGTNIGTRHVPEQLASFRVHAGSTTAANMTIRAARKKVDPLVIYHDFAFNPHYAALRRRCRATRPHIDFADEFWIRAYDTLIADKIADTLAHGDAITANEIAALFQAYPRLAAANWTSKATATAKRRTRNARSFIQRACARLVP